MTQVIDDDIDTPIPHWLDPGLPEGFVDVLGYDPTLAPRRLSEEPEPDPDAKGERERMTYEIRYFQEALAMFETQGWERVSAMFRETLRQREDFLKSPACAALEQVYATRAEIAAYESFLSLEARLKDEVQQLNEKLEGR